MTTFSSSNATDTAKNGSANIDGHYSTGLAKDNSFAEQSGISYFVAVSAVDLVSQLETMAQYSPIDCDIRSVQLNVAIDQQLNPARKTVIIYDAVFANHTSIKSFIEQAISMGLVLAQIDGHEMLSIHTESHLLRQRYNLASFFKLIQQRFIQESNIALQAQWQHKYLELLQHSSDAVFLTDLSGKILRGNETAQLWCQDQPKALAGRFIGELFIDFQLADFVGTQLAASSHTSSAQLSMPEGEAKATVNIRCVRGESQALDKQSLIFLVSHKQGYSDQTEPSAGSVDQTADCKVESNTNSNGAAELASEDSFRLAVDDCIAGQASVFVFCLELQPLASACLPLVFSKLRSLVSSDCLTRSQQNGDIFFAIENLSNQNAALMARSLNTFVSGLELSDDERIQADSGAFSMLIGIASTTNDGSNAQVLIEKSYAAKENARTSTKPSSYYFASQSARDEIEFNRKALNSLRLAVKREEFRMMYEPIMDLQSSEIIGVEALLRWEHPDQGLIDPFSYLDAVEAAGFMERIANWSLGQIREDCLALSLIHI